MKSDLWWKRQIAYIQRGRVQDVTDEDMVRYKCARRAEEDIRLTVRRMKGQRWKVAKIKLKSIGDIVLWLVAVGGFALSVYAAFFK